MFYLKLYVCCTLKLRLYSVLDMNQDSKPEVKIEDLFLQDRICEAQHQTVKEEVTCSELQIKSESLDQSFDIKSEESVKLEMVSEDLDLITERLQNDREQATVDPTITKPFHCTLCDLKFTRNTYLKYHMRTHTRETPFQCTICNLTFKTSSDFGIHIITHTGEQPFKFCQKIQLVNHNISSHTSEKRFHCNICDAKFTESSNLKHHIRTHTGEKPFKCNACGARFAQCGNLRKHINVHIGEKPFQCDICELRCAQKVTLIRHIQRKHKKA